MERNGCNKDSIENHEEYVFVGRTAKFVYVGEGTLISPSGLSEENRYFCTVQYRNLGQTPGEVMALIQRAAIQEGDACVGFHVTTKASDGRYLEAALLYDTDKVILLGDGTVPMSFALEKEEAKISWAPIPEPGGAWAGTGSPFKQCA
jgi:hypothetical protein